MTARWDDPSYPDDLPAPAPWPPDKPCAYCSNLDGTMYRAPEPPDPSPVPWAKLSCVECGRWFWSLD